MRAVWAATLVDAVVDAVILKGRDFLWEQYCNPLRSHMRLVGLPSVICVAIAIGSGGDWIASEFKFSPVPSKLDFPFERVKGD